MTILRAAALTACLLVGCEKRAPDKLAPASSALTSAAPASRSAVRFRVDPARSKASFVMDAPLEKIHGEAEASGSGELFVDPEDLRRTTGLIKVDLKRLELFQQRRSAEQGDYGARVKSERQNEHMRTWLEIADDAPTDVRERNRYVEFKLLEIDDPNPPRLSPSSTAEQKLTAKVRGELRLHGRKSTQITPVEALFQFEGNRPKSVAIRTLQPIAISLEEHDVRPREAFGKLAEATLDTLGKKVARVAPVNFEFIATAE